MIKLVLFSTIMALFLCSCAKNTTTELTAEQKASIEKEIREQFDKVVSAISQLDADLYFETISKDEFISHISSRRGLTFGYSAWMDTIKVSFSRRERHQSEPLDVKVTALSTDLALLTSNAIWENWWSGNYRKTNGKATYLWKNEPDGWKIIHIHESGDVIEEKLAD